MLFLLRESGHKDMAYICMVLRQEKKKRGSTSSLMLSTSHSCISSRRHNFQVPTQQIYILIPHSFKPEIPATYR